MDRRTGSPAEAENWLPDGAARRPAKPRRASSPAPKPEDWLPADAAHNPRRQALVALPGLGPAGGDEPRPELQPSSEERQQEAIARLGGAGADVSLQTRPSPRWPAIDSFDPNTVSAGELLRFGLSKTQTARFLARQEQPGGFCSVEDLDKLRGFPAALRDKLKAAARISA